VRFGEGTDGRSTTSSRKCWKMARSWGLVRLGHVAVDSTRVRGAASRDRMDTESKLRRERARLRRQIRRWQKACDADDPDENAGMQVKVKELERRLEQIPRRLERLRKSGLRQISRTDPESRFCGAGRVGNWATRRRLR